MDTQNFVDKSAWPRGEWNDEPDKLEWRDAATGLPCLIVRHRSGGHLCGYVGIPSTHPLHGKSYDDPNVNVHGGLTYADACQEGGHVCHIPQPGEDPNVWWFGFDCAHAGDESPGFRAIIGRGSRGFWPDRGDEYRNVAYVKAECASLAQQLRGLFS